MFVAYLNDEKYRDIWNKYILSEGGGFWQSWEWGQVQKKNGKEVFYIAVFKKDDSGRDIFCAACSVFLETIFFGKTFLSIYRGPLMNFFSSENYPAIEMIFAELEKIAKEKKTLFLRIDPPVLISSASYLGAYFSTLDKTRIEASSRRLTEKSRKRVRIDRPEGDILSEFSTKFSYHLKIAKSRFETSSSNNSKDIVRYLPLLKEKEQIKKEIAFLSDCLHHFSAAMPARTADSEESRADCSYVYSIKIFLAKEKENTAAAAAVIYCGSCAYVFYEKNFLVNDLSPLYLLHWDIIKDAQLNGMDIYETSREKSAVADDIGGTQEFLSDSYDIIYAKFWYKMLKKLKLQ